MVIGYLPSSGLLVGAPSDVVKGIGLVSSVLAALGYTVNRTNLKRALVSGVSAAARVSGVLFLALGLGVGAVAMSTPGCAPATQAASCTLTTLEQQVGNQTLAQEVEAALLAGNYLAALEGVAVTAGEVAVNCVLTAIRDLAGAELAAGSAAAGSAAAGSGSGVAAHSVELDRAQLLYDRATAALKARGGK